MRVAAIIAAAGQGLRVGADRPKQFLEIGGASMLQRSVDAFVGSDRIDEIVVALPESELENPPSYLRRSSKPLTLVAGGAHRQASVARAFAKVSPAIDVVVVHDAARPFVSRDLIARAVDAASAYGAAIAALPVRDTVKQVGSGADSRIVRTLPRESIFLAQTPQAFRRDLLQRALAEAGEVVVTDEAMLLERLGVEVCIVAGDERNIKVTTAGDLARAAEAVDRLARASADAAHMRIGTGYDLHRLVVGRPLILAGVRVPFEQGLQGHSDADIVCHAVTDAILGAASLGDIGRLFPDSDEQWKDADSLDLLRRAMEAVRRAGYVVVNADVTIIAERPKLLPYLDQMRANLAAALGITAATVSIKGKTNEGVGEIGRGEAMACHAAALLASSESSAGLQSRDGSE